LLALFKVTYRIANCRTPHLIGVNLMLPAATDLIERMLGESYAKEFQKIPPTENTVGRRLSNILEDLCDQLIDQFKAHILYIASK